MCEWLTDTEAAALLGAKRQHLQQLRCGRRVKAKGKYYEYPPKLTPADWKYENRLFYKKSAIERIKNGKFKAEKDGKNI